MPVPQCILMVCWTRQKQRSIWLFLCFNSRGFCHSWPAVLLYQRKPSVIRNAGKKLLEEVKWWNTYFHPPSNRQFNRQFRQTNGCTEISAITDLFWKKEIFKANDPYSQYICLHILCFTVMLQTKSLLQTLVLKWIFFIYISTNTFWLICKISVSQLKYEELAEYQTS